MRGVLTAVKVVRARKKLAEHPKEPLEYIHQGLLEALVERHILGLKDAVDAMLRAWT